MKKTLMAITLVSIVIPMPYQQAYSAARKEIKLAKPAMTGGMPLMAALAKRQSSRSFSSRPLAEQTLSNLLWAANGVNRPEAGKRTAPSAMNRQEIDIYAAMEEGLYLYDAKKHALVLVLDKDIRPLTGRQGFINKAALNLVYVADMSSVAGTGSEEKMLYAGADTGFIGQNVYLFCASEGLSTVIRGWVDKDALAKAMGLTSSQVVILSQTVGYPGK